MKKQSTWIGVIAIAMLVLMTVAPAFGAGRQEAAAEEQITLRFSWWGGETRHNAVLDALDLFMAENPNIRVEAEFSGWDGYIDRLRTQMAANNQPDIFVAGHEGPWEVLPWSARADIRDFDIDISAYSDVQLAMIQAADPDGRLLGLPMSESIRAVYLINETLLSELGIPFPDRNWTWDDLATLSQQIYDESGGATHGVLDEFGGITYGSNGRRAFDLAIHGSPVTAADGLTLTADQMRLSYEWWGALRDSGAATPAAITVQADDGANSPLVTRDAAMLTISLGSYARFQANTPDNLVVHPVPVGEFPNDELAAGTNLQFSSASRHPEATARLYNFLRNDPRAGAIIGTEFGIPANSRFRDALIAEGLNEASEAQFEIHNWTVQNREVISFDPPHASYSEFRELKWAEEQALAFGRQSIEQTVRNVIQHARNLGL